MPYIIKYNYTHTHTHIYIYCELGSTLAAPPGNSPPSDQTAGLSLTAQQKVVGVSQAASGHGQVASKGKVLSAKTYGWPQQRKSYGLASVRWLKKHFTTALPLLAASAKKWLSRYI